MLPLPPRVPMNGAVYLGSPRGGSFIFSDPEGA